MNLQDIQTETFRQLVNIASKLKKNYLCIISRNQIGNMELRIHKIESNIFSMNWHCAFVIIRNTRTKAKITAEINRIWQEIPAEAKR